VKKAKGADKNGTFCFAHQQPSCLSVSSTGFAI
jgi:hypothetical protein